ncbi:MAG TPA: J domain-containing protein [Streptosporangiaceae bacterium]|nr:J domain-containing protein [Streptosporangiaceae bacterium]
MTPNPFAVLGLPEWPELEDETVRAAWRAIAAETHPDREDGGDLARYTQATAAFAVLNTPWGRSEAYADLVEAAWANGRFDDYPDTCPAAEEPLPVVFVPVVFVPRPVPLREVLAMVAQVPSRIHRGHPLRLLLRAAVIAGLCAAVLTVFPAVPHLPAAIVAGLWCAMLARADLAPPPGC